jgi:ATP-dependent helicase/DNAse subunit B
MEEDKYSAIWVSHTSISDFLKCPKAYYYKHIYRNPQSGNKIKLMSPPLALGQAVHEVVESLSVLPVEKRFEESLIEKFTHVWKKVSGKKGGFTDDNTEKKYKERGKEMLRMITNNPGPLKKLAVKIQEDLPHYWLSKEDNIILCGKIDWLEYLPDNDSVHIIDFKTGKQRDNSQSLQLPIYHLLVHNCQKRNVEKASYWYIAHQQEPEEMELPDLEDAHKQVLKIAKKIKLARKLERFKCPEGEDGCRYCSRLRRIASGEGEYVGKDNYDHDIFILPRKSDKKESVIL